MNSFTPQGDYFIVVTPTGIDKISTSTWEVIRVVDTGRPVKVLCTGHSKRVVYFIRDTKDGKEFCSSQIDYPPDSSNGNSSTPSSSSSHNVKVIYKIPSNIGTSMTVNSDDTLIAGVEEFDHLNILPTLQISKPVNPSLDQVQFSHKWPDGTEMSYQDAKETAMDQRLESRIPMRIFTVNIETGEKKYVWESDDWLNHLIFSPTDKNVLMFCHEGPWHKVDRLWYLDLSLSEEKRIPIKVHERTMNMEIWGHEWFSSDGTKIYYDLQTPRGIDFWVASYDLNSGKRKRWHVPKPEYWGVHFNSNHHSNDKDLFVSDGGDENMVAKVSEGNGKWLNLLIPQEVPYPAGIKANNSDELIDTAYFKCERLVNLEKHDYVLEPNAFFTRDGKWVIFRSNMSGEVHTYAVEVEKTAN